MAVHLDPRSVPRLPPPSAQRGVVGWLRHNLFRTPGDSVLTVVVLAVLAWVVIHPDRSLADRIRAPTSAR